MENKAQSLIEEAKEKVKLRFEETEAEIEQMLANARTAGWQRGEEESCIISAKLDGLKEGLDAELREEVLKGALQIAENILKAELDHAPESVLSIALRALSLFPDAQHVYVRANPQDVDFLRDDKERLINRLERAKDIDIRADKQVLRGGLLIQSEYGIVDAQMSTQLEEIARAMGVSSWRV